TRVCCCARAANGHAAAPRSVMNSRRLILDMGTSSPVEWRLPHRAGRRRRPVYRTLNLPQSTRQVLGSDLNPSESGGLLAATCAAERIAHDTLCAAGFRSNLTRLGVRLGDSGRADFKLSGLRPACPAGAP